MQDVLLKNNHLMMNTQVETFIIEETEALIYDNAQLEKWHELVGKLDLKGQKKVAKEGLSPVPFLYMNNIMMKVCRTLCPSHKAIEAYDLTPIPMPVLDLVALSKKENYFQQIEIWYDEQSPDPFCVGIAGYWKSGDSFDFMDEMEEENEAQIEAQIESGSKRFDSEAAVIAYQKALGKVGLWRHFVPERHYLIAKWGDVKQSFEELTERAKTRHKEGMIAGIQSRIAIAQLQLARVDADCNDYFLRADITDEGLPF